MTISEDAVISSYSRPYGLIRKRLPPFAADGSLALMCAGRG